MRRADTGNYSKGALAGWGVDLRDPTADRRLVEYCLSVPTDQYLKDGVPRALGKRALADRLPEAVINQRFKGYQSADWYEGLTAARGDIVTIVSSDKDLMQLVGGSITMLDPIKNRRIGEALVDRLGSRGRPKRNPTFSRDGPMRSGAVSGRL